MVSPLKEVELLLERAALKLSAAKMLFDEKYYDDAVSRAYYSMYFAAKAMLLTKDIAPKTHKGLIRMFGMEFINKGFIEKMYGEALSTAKEDREDADYSLICEITKEEAEFVVGDAEMFLDRIKEALMNIK